MKVRLISSDKTTELTQGTDYIVTDRVVTLTNPTDLKIQIYRETTTKPLVGWADASVLRAVDMTVQSTQLLHLSEETEDKVQDGGLAKDTDDGVWDARYNRIKNLLDPQNPGDAVTLSYIVANQTSLLTQLKSTGEAERVSIVSTGDTQDKRLNDIGDRYVELMTSLKDTTVQKASEAEASADEAEEWANKAKASADKAGVSESNAKASEEEAKKQAEAADKSAKSAINSFMNTTSIHSAVANMKNETEKKAEEAKESADKAAQSATEAAQFDPTTYVRSVTEAEGKVTVTKGNGEVNTFNAGLNILARNKQYNVGDIAYSPNLPSYLYLECVTAGTTGDTEPDFSNIKSGGVTINDGTVKFKTVKIVTTEIIKKGFTVPITSDSNGYFHTIINIAVTGYMFKGIAEWRFSDGFAILSEWWTDDATGELSIWIKTEKPNASMKFYFYVWYVKL